jgi:pimeloyl-ACP methyl ester carboxylesterase
MKNIIQSLICFFCILLFSCGGPQSKPKPDSLDKTKIINDSVAISYEDTEVGDTTLLFIHGWNINKTYWADQDSYFSKKYRVITIDLPGFGNSGKNRKEWTVEKYEKDISAVLKQLNLHHVILIGHSMSGAIALEATLKNPDRIIGLVGIDNFTGFGSIPSEEENKAVAEVYKALKTNYTELVTQYANEYLFSPTTDSLDRKRIMNDFINADSLLAVEILEKNEQYPLNEKLKSYGKPLYLINSTFHPTDTTGFIKYKVPYKLHIVGPTGHYPMIENPTEFNKQLEQIMKEIGK